MRESTSCLLLALLACFLLAFYLHFKIFGAISVGQMGNGRPTHIHTPSSPRASLILGTIPPQKAHKGGRMAWRGTYSSGKHWTSVLCARPCNAVVGYTDRGHNKVMYRRCVWCRNSAGYKTLAFEPQTRTPSKMTAHWLKGGSVGKLYLSTQTSNPLQRSKEVARLPKKNELFPKCAGGAHPYL